MEEKKALATTWGDPPFCLRRALCSLPLTGSSSKECPVILMVSVKLCYLLTYCPSCHRQLGQQQVLSISAGLEPVSVRFSINVPWLLPLPQQYVSMSSLDASVSCVPLVSIRLLRSRLHPNSSSRKE